MFYGTGSLPLLSLTVEGEGWRLYMRLLLFIFYVLFTNFFSIASWFQTLENSFMGLSSGSNKPFYDVLRNVWKEENNENTVSVRGFK